jgi:predicted dehydrogenase
MLAAAAAAGRVLAVGHVEFHNPAVAALLAAGGVPRFVEIERLGVFSPRSLDIDVVADLMIHDLQILHALDGSALVEVRAWASRCSRSVSTSSTHDSSSPPGWWPT